MCVSEQDLPRRGSLWRSTVCQLGGRRESRKNWRKATWRWSTSEKLLRSCGDGNVFQTSWWRRREKCHNCRAQGRDITLCKTSFGEGKSDEIVQSKKGHHENEINHYDTLKLFRISYSWRVFHKPLEYVPHDRENKLVQVPILSLLRSEAWIVTVVWCFWRGIFAVGKVK